MSWEDLQRDVRAARWPTPWAHRCDVEQLLGTMQGETLAGIADRATDAGHTNLAQRLGAEAVDVSDPHMAHAMRLLGRAR